MLYANHTLYPNPNKLNCTPRWNENETLAPTGTLRGPLNNALLIFFLWLGNRLGHWLILILHTESLQESAGRSSSNPTSKNLSDRIFIKWRFRQALCDKAHVLSCVSVWHTQNKLLLTILSRNKLLHYACRYFTQTICSGAPLKGHAPQNYRDTSVLRTLCYALNMLSDVKVPLKWGLPSIENTSPGPQGVNNTIEGFHCIQDTLPGPQCIHNKGTPVCIYFTSSYNVIENKN